jgi:hypothetical protein
MDIQKLFDYIAKNPNINITYTNIDGKESLTVNGKEVEGLEDTEELEKIKEDANNEDVKLKEEIDEWESFLEDIDDCVYEQVIDFISEDIDIKHFDDLTKQKTWTDCDREIVRKTISYINSVIKQVLLKKISYYKKLVNEL